MAAFKHGLFGCFGNMGICIITFLVPCYTFGKNAEAVGSNCCLCCLLNGFPVVNILAGTYVRGQVRAKYGIDGSLISDFLTFLCCPFCAIIQEAQELTEPEPVSMSRSAQENQEAPPPPPPAGEDTMPPA